MKKYCLISQVLLLLFLTSFWSSNVKADPTPATENNSFQYFSTSFPNGELKNSLFFQEFVTQIKDHPWEENPQTEANFPYNVIMVRGLYTKIYVDLVSVLGYAITPPEGMVDSFYDVRTWLTKQNIENSLLPTNTELSADTNAIELKLAIEKSTKPVILLSHCKGGTDVLHTLVKYPELKSKVAGWVALQSTFQGASIADFIIKNPPAAYILYGGILARRGEWSSFVDVSAAEAAKFNAENKEKIENVVKEIPIISVGTNFTPEPIWNSYTFIERYSLLDPLNRFISWLGEEHNDGLVPTLGACLPGTACLFLDKFDHGDAVMSLYPFHSIGYKNRMLLNWGLLQMIHRKHLDLQH